MLKKKLKGIKNDQNLSELIKGSLVTFVLKVGGMLLSYLVVYLISRKFGKEGIGYYSLTNQLLLLTAAFATMGTTTSVLRYVGQFHTEESSSGIRRLYQLIWQIILPVSIIMGITGYFTSDFLAESVFKNPSYSDAIKVISFFLPLFVLDRIAVEFIRGFKELKVSEFIRTVSRPLIMSVCLVFLWKEQIGEIYLIYFICLAIIVNAIISNGFVINRVSRFRKSKRHSLTPGELLSVSTPMMVSAFTSLLITTAPLFILEYYVSTDKVGLYSIAFKLSQVITVVLVVVNTIAAPKFSELFWSKKTAELQRVISQSTKMMFWSSFSLSLVMIIGADPFLGVFADAHDSAYWPLIILVISQMVNAATGSVGLFLNMSGNQKILRNTALIAMTLMFVLSFLLIPRYEITGAAISAGAGGILWNLLCILYVKRELGIVTYYYPTLSKSK